MLVELLHNRNDVYLIPVSFSYAVEVCALHRIINTKQTASIRCISTQINGMQVYIIHSGISMNKYIYKVKFVFI